MDQITVFLGANEDDDKKVISLLEDFKGKKEVSIKYIRDAGILDDWFKMPFIETAEGDRFFGIESIKKFIQKQYQ
jgi:hypothetical protein